MIRNYARNGAMGDSALFINAVSKIGWGNLILIWRGLMIIGIVVLFPVKVKKG